VYREDLLLRTWALLQGLQEIGLPDDIDRLVRLVYEEEVEIPDMLQERMAKAIEESDGEAYAHACKAHQAIIGSPGDASWDDPARFTQSDEDDPNLHVSLRALTRLGDPSVTVVPIFDGEAFDLAKEPREQEARDLVMRALNLTRIEIVKRLTAEGVPEGWERSPLLRHCYPLRLDREGRWVEAPHVRMDDHLGLVFDAKETA
jgi:CRISPR-associated endonuclease/helicase Cas3